MVTFGEVESFLEDMRASPQSVDEDFAEDLREFITDIYTSGVDDPDLVDLLDDLRWILSHRDRTAAERFRAMIYRFDKWRDSHPR
jgi:hypothetical protein